MNATSFQVPERFGRSSAKHGEPWSRNPVINAAQIRILLLAGIVPLPRFDAISTSVAARINRTEIFSMLV
jgi:hypothetical protein